MDPYNVIIAGGGLAGLTAAIHLSARGLQVLVIEKTPYPHHKVCGEYLSNETKPYLDSLGIALPSPVPIDQLLLSTVNGRSLEVALPLGGMGISRYALDHALYLKAADQGVHVIFDTVVALVPGENGFSVHTKHSGIYRSRIALGACGKRSLLDRSLNRGFINRKSPWLAVKAHYRLDDFPENLVALHNFKGGYAGLSKTESGVVNFCYLAHYKSFECVKDIDNFNKNVVAENPFLADFLHRATPLFNKPLTIAQLSFESKDPVEKHILMCGDAAGLIHPLCGNGMAMAMHSAKMASELILSFLLERSLDYEELEGQYRRQWERTFGSRLRRGAQLQRLLLNSAMANRLMGIAARSPRLVQHMIRQTHGEPITV